MASNVENMIDVRREEWLPRTDSVGPVKFGPISRWTDLEVHHLGSAPLSTWGGDPFKAWQSAFNYHVNTKKWQDIWYQLGIHPDGRLVELRGAGASNSSRPYLAVNLPGSDESTEAQWDTIHRLRVAMFQDGAMFDLRYHAMRGGTICPGPNTIDRIHQIWAAEDSVGGRLVNSNHIDPEAYLEGQANLAVMNHPVIALLSSFPNGNGYATIHSDGGIATFGTFPYLGSVPELVDLIELGDPVTHAHTTWVNSAPGYRMVTSRGAIFNFGSAQYHGRLDIVGD